MANINDILRVVREIFGPDPLSVDCTGLSGYARLADSVGEVVRLSPMEKNCACWVYTTCSHKDVLAAVKYYTVKHIIYTKRCAASEVVVKLNIRTRVPNDGPDTFSRAMSSVTRSLLLLGLVLLDYNWWEA